MGRYRDAMIVEAPLERARRGRGVEELLRQQWPCLVRGGGLSLEPFQLDLVRSAFDPAISEVVCKGGASVGKGTAVALAVNLHFLAWPEAKVVVTSSSHEHVVKVLFAEVKKWRRLMAGAQPGELLEQSVEDKGSAGQRYVKVANPKADESFRGHHSAAPQVMFVFDEASAVPEDRYKLAKTQAHKILAVSNPSAPSGWFRAAFPAHDPDRCQTVGRRRCLTASARDCRNVREGREAVPGQVTRAQLAEIEAAGPWYRSVMAEGRFPPEDLEARVILPSWLPRHVEAWRAFHRQAPEKTTLPALDLRVAAFGLDVAASGSGDESALAAGSSQGVRALHRWRHSDTMSTVGRVLALAEARYGIDLKAGEAPVAVDMDGIGKGVGDRLAEQGVNVVEHRGNAPAENPTLYANARAESYGELGRRLDPAGPWSDQAWALPDDPRLLEELAAPEKVHGSDGLRFRLTPKDHRPGSRFPGRTVREKLGRSPDSADAVAYLYAAVRRSAERPLAPLPDASWVPDLGWADRMLEGM